MGFIVLAAATAGAQTPIQARRADDFVDSMGINVHMESTTKPYNEYCLVNERLSELGMRHIRDEINDPDPAFVSEMQQIGTLGYRLLGVIAGGNDYPSPGTHLKADLVLPMIYNLEPVIEAMEGPNEPDGRGFLYDGSPYPEGAIRESEDLWNIVKGSPELRDLPVLVISEGNPAKYATLAAITPPPIDYATYGNMHAYQGGGVGDGSGQNNLGTYIRDSRLLTGGKSLWTTEMGYHNNTSYLVNGEQQGVSQRASAIYLPIAFLSGFGKGVLRTFSYELVDEGKDPPPDCSGYKHCSGEGYYGLLNFDFTPKPAFTALQNLIALVSNPGGTNFEPESLPIGFSGAPNTMEHVLLQKSNGEFYLALWNDVSVYQTATCAAFGMNGNCTKITPGMDVYPPDVAVTLTFGAPQTFTVYAPNDASGADPTAAYTISTTMTSIQIKLPPQVLLIKIVGQ